jgi:hypothetical protein
MAKNENICVMKLKFIFLLISLLVFNTLCFSQINPDKLPNLTELKGPYIGQDPPGERPQVFAPTILFSENAIHGQIAFHPNGKEIYWIFLSSKYAQNPPKINCIKQINGYWIMPEILPFTEKYGALNISISPDGKRLYFNSNRPWPSSWGKQPNDNIIEAYKIWYVERVDSGWGNPKLLDKHINQNTGGVSPTSDLTLYTHGIKRARIKDGQYTSWEQLGQPLNLGRILGGHPYIASDESYILFNRKWSGKRGYGIFISYRTNTESWTEPFNILEKLGASRGGSQPIVSPDGKYLFYYAKKKFYWIDAKIITDIKPNDMK